MSGTALFQEALYYGLLDQVRAAKWGPLDGDTMVRAQLVPGYGRASHVDLKFRGSMPMIRSNADSGCCVSCDAVVRTYDWTLQQQAVMSLKYAHACDVAYMGTSRVLVGTIDCDDASDPTGMACFDASSGAMLHQYQLTDGWRSWSFNGNNITTSEGEHVFAACRYNGDEDCVVIGTWDQTTGQQVQLLDLTMFGITSRCNMYKLQWLPTRNLLVVTTVDVNEGASISLFDMRSRQRSMMWPQDGSIMMSQETLMDVVAMEDSSTIWAADDSDRLGLLDIRGGLAGGADWIWWCDPGDVFAVSPSAPRGSGPYVRQPKLAYWGSRLFASREDSIHVVGNTNWAGPGCAVTATVQRAPGGEISDMSIGGDRLFVAH